MSIPTFTPGTPPDGSTLGQTKKNVRDNLDGNFQVFSIDHVSQNESPAGYHNVVHVVPQGSNPAPVTGYGQLYSKTVNSYTTDEALFWETGNGLIQQLTTNIIPTALSVTNGYTFLAGGLIFQWGEITSATKNSLTVGNFNVTFPNNNFTLQGTLSSGTSGSVITLTSFSQSEFHYFINTNSSQTLNFFWWAIGN
jgi:hypothetical protein